MLNQLVEYYNILFVNLSQYPVAQGAVASTIALGVTATVGLLLWKLPMLVCKFIISQFTTSLCFNNQGASQWDDRMNRQFNGLIDWLSKNKLFKLSRSLTFGYSNNKESRGPGIGRHLFHYGKRLCWVTISEQQVNGSQATKYQVVLTMLGRSHTRMYEILDAFSVVEIEDDNLIELWGNTRDGWEYSGSVLPRNENTLILAPDIHHKIFDTARNFVKNSKWYHDRAISYRLTYLLYGEPGTGKTSIAKTMASVLKRPLYRLNLDYGTSDLVGLLLRAKGGIVLIEDIDTYAFSKTRELPVATPAAEGMDKGKISQLAYPSPAPSATEKLLGISLSSFLNALDGVADLNDLIIIMTTNKPLELDPALVRDGRVDVRLNIPRLNNEEIHRYVKLYFPDHDSSHLEFQPIPGATVHAKFMENKLNPTNFCESLLNVQVNTEPMGTVLK